MVVGRNLHTGIISSKYNFPCRALLLLTCKFLIEFRTKGVFIWRKVSPIGRASPLCRDPASQLNSLSKFIFVYMRGGPALLGGISLLTTRDLA